MGWHCDRGQIFLGWLWLSLLRVAPRGQELGTFGNQGGAKIPIALVVVAKMSINIGFFFELIL